MTNLCEQLLARVDEMREAWQTQSTRTALRAGITRLAAVTPSGMVRCSVAAAVCTRIDPGARNDAWDACAWTAVEYGEFVRSLEVADTVLLGILDQLRPAIWRQLTALRDHSSESLRAISRIDALLGFVSRAALAGFHRAEYTEAGAWPAAVEQLIAEGRAALG